VNVTERQAARGKAQTMIHHRNELNFKGVLVCKKFGASRRKHYGARPETSVNLRAGCLIGPTA